MSLVHMDILTSLLVRFDMLNDLMIVVRMHLYLLFVFMSVLVVITLVRVGLSGLTLPYGPGGLPRSILRCVLRLPVS